MTPLNGYVVVNRLDEEELTSGKVVFRSGEWSSDSGNPLYVPVNVGDTVLFMEEDSLRITVNGEKLFLVHSHDLFAKF